MPNVFPLLLAAASTEAGNFDALFWGITLITAFFAGLIAAAILVLSIYYRRGSKVDRSNPPQYGIVIELAWTLIPLGLALGIFVWSTVLYFSAVRVPSNAMDVYVVGKQWMWKIQHPEGRWEMDELHVPVGRPIRLTMTSEDVIHSFFIPAFRVKQDVVPGRYSQLWFEATKVGTYHLFCAQFCGTNHSGMVGSVVVMQPADYERWLSAGTYQGSLAQAGELLFRRSGCTGCHGVNASVRAPSLEGIYGKPVAVQIPQVGVPLTQIPATTEIADDRYIHDSILLPEKEVAAGYNPIMPTFQGKLAEDEIFELIAYIKSLSTSNGTSNGSTGVPETGNNPGTIAGPLTPQDYKARVGFVPANIKRLSRVKPSPGRPGLGAAAPETGVMGRQGVNTIESPQLNTRAVPSPRTTAGAGAGGPPGGGATTGGATTGGATTGGTSERTPR